MNSYVWIRIKMSNYMNSYVWICIKISEKKRKKKKKVGISTRDQYGLQSLQRHAIHPPTSSVSAHFIYIPYNKKTIRKSGLYDFTHMAYSQPLKWLWCGHQNSCSETFFFHQKSRRWAPESGGASCPWSYYGGFSSSSTCVSFALLTIKMYGHSVSIFFLLI